MTEIPFSDNPSGMYCPDCRLVGMSHCSDPINCGGMIPMRERPIIKEDKNPLDACSLSSNSQAQ